MSVVVAHLKDMSYCHVDYKNSFSYGLGKQLESECLENFVDTKVGKLMSQVLHSCPQQT